MKSHTFSILVDHIEYITIKDSKHLNFNRVNPLYLIFNKVNGYFEEINGNEYLRLVPSNDSKKKKKNEIQKEKLWSEIKNLIRLINSDDERYMKIKFNLDNELPLNKGIEIPSMLIVITAIFL